MTYEYKEVYDNYLGNLIFPKYDDGISAYIEEHHIWSEPEVQWIMENVKQGDTCINVGSNVGYFTCLMSKRVGISGSVFSIEANPQLEYYLKENVKRTGIDNVKIIMSAAGDNIGEIDLYVNASNCGDNRLHNPMNISNPTWDAFSEKEVLTVKIDKVDNLVTAEKVDIVLMDCQGWDHKVIRGMSQIIAKHRPKILLEYTPKWIKSLGEDPVDILNEYIAMGYKITCPELGIYEYVEPRQLIQLIVSNPEKEFASICLDT